MEMVKMLPGCWVFKPPSWGVFSHPKTVVTFWFRHIIIEKMPLICIYNLLNLALWKGFSLFFFFCLLLLPLLLIISSLFWYFYGTGRVGRFGRRWRSSTGKHGDSSRWPHTRAKGLWAGDDNLVSASHNTCLFDISNKLHTCFHMYAIITINFEDF